MGRALLKRAIAEGRLSAAQVILDCPREAHSLGVHTLLTWQRQWGTIRARKLLARMPIPEKKAVGQLTDRQRRELVAVLGHRSNGAMEGEGDGI
jgi:hypothetical protein